MVSPPATALYPSVSVVGATAETARERVASATAPSQKDRRMLPPPLVASRGVTGERKPLSAVAETRGLQAVAYASAGSS